MNMKKIALAVAATVVSSSAFAAELYNNNGTTFSVGGYFDVDLSDPGSEYEESVAGSGNYDKKVSGDVGINQVSPRLNIVGKQDIGNGMTVEAKGEWQTNLVDGGSTTFTTRLGYLALHTPMGKVTAGTQWSPFYNVSAVTDIPIKYANNYLYDGGRTGAWGDIGTGRADQMLSYSNNLNFGGDSDLYFGAGWQGKTGDFDNRYQAAASFSFVGITFGLAYTGGDVMNDKLNITSLSASYGTYGDGIYVAGNWGITDGLYAANEDANQLSALAAYGLQNGVNLILYYETVEHDDDLVKISSSEPYRDILAPQVEFTVTPQFVTFAGFQTHLGDDKADDQWSAGMRYFF